MEDVNKISKTNPTFTEFFNNLFKPKGPSASKIRKELGEELTNSYVKIKQLSGKIGGLKKEINKLRGEDHEKENYWNNKWKKSVIIYNARNNLKYDVREFISYPNVILSALRKEIKIYDNDSNDKIALKVLNWILDNYTYKSDEGEYWSFPTDTFYSKNDDCEGFTNLYVSILRNLGIPAYRIKNCCGFVLDPKTNQRYGHSYPIYLRDAFDGFVSMDLTFLPNRNTVEKRPLHKAGENNYSDIWFTFSDIHSFSPVEVETSGKIRDEEIRSDKKD